MGNAQIQHQTVDLKAIKLKHFLNFKLLFKLGNGICTTHAEHIVDLVLYKHLLELENCIELGLQAALLVLCAVLLWILAMSSLSYYSAKVLL